MGTAKEVNGGNGNDVLKVNKKRPPIVHPWQILQKEVERLDAIRRKEKKASQLLFSTDDIILLNSLGFSVSAENRPQASAIDTLFKSVGKGNYLQISVNVNAPPIDAYKGARHPHTIVLHERADSDGADFSSGKQPNFFMLYHDDEREVKGIPGGVLTKAFFHLKSEMQSLFDKEISGLFSNSNIYRLTEGGKDIEPDVTIYHIDGTTGERKRLKNNVLLDLPKIKNFMTFHKNTNRLTIGMAIDSPDLIDTVLSSNDEDGEIPLTYSFPSQMLNMAVQKNAPNVVGLLMDAVAAHGLEAEINKPYYLFVAAREGHLEMMDLLVARGISPTEPVSSRGNQLPIHAAVTHGKLDAVKKLQAFAPGTINPLPGSPDVPLVLAVAHNQMDVAKYLVDQGADVNAVDRNGNVAIVSAARTGNIQAVHHLHVHGAELEPVNNPAIAPLVAAAGAGKAQVMEYLLPLVDIEQRDICGRTALFAAAQNGHGHIVSWLIEQGAAIDPRDENGETPYRQAVSGGHLAIAQDLLDAGADPFARDYEGKDILTKVQEWGENDLARFCLKVMRAAEEKTTGNSPVSKWRERRDAVRKLEPPLQGMDM